MIESILALLELDEYQGVSKRIDIAKGKHKLTTSFKEAWQQRKRDKAWQ
tara:strand:- start:479 stop:625 length:147 start_codon:yes stop_codon:yes gene_type:complete